MNKQVEFSVINYINLDVLIISGLCLSFPWQSLYLSEIFCIVLYYLGIDLEDNSRSYLQELFDSFQPVDGSGDQLQDADTSDGEYQIYEQDDDCGNPDDDDDWHAHISVHRLPFTPFCSIHSGIINFYGRSWTRIWNFHVWTYIFWFVKFQMLKQNFNSCPDSQKAQPVTRRPEQPHQAAGITNALLQKKYSWTWKIRQWVTILEIARDDSIDMLLYLVE